MPTAPGAQFLSTGTDAVQPAPDRTPEVALRRGRGAAVSCPGGISSWGAGLHPGHALGSGRQTDPHDRRRHRGQGRLPWLETAAPAPGEVRGLPILSSALSCRTLHGCVCGRVSSGNLEDCEAFLGSHPARWASLLAYPTDSAHYSLGAPTLPGKKKHLCVNLNLSSGNNLPLPPTHTPLAICPSSALRAVPTGLYLFVCLQVMVASREGAEGVFVL